MASDFQSTWMCERDNKVSIPSVRLSLSGAATLQWTLNQHTECMEILQYINVRGKTMQYCTGSFKFYRSVIKTWRARKLRCSCTYRWMMRYCVEINLGEQRIFKIISFYVRRVYSKPRSCPRRRSLTTAAHSITSGTGNVAMAWTISCMHFEIPRYAIRNKWFLLSRKEGLWEKWNINDGKSFVV